MKYLIILLIPILGMAGCKKFLTTQPSDFVEPSANYSTEGQLLDALAGVYDVLGMNRKALYANDYYTYLNACNDLSFYGRSSKSSGTEVYNFDYTDPIINDTWDALYTGIERANNLIAHINDAKSADPVAKNAILGEAQFLRGYYYFLLVSNFGGVPLRIQPTTITGAKNVEVPRNTAEEVYSQILKDMHSAEGKVYPATHFIDASRVNQSIVQGIMARVFLTMAGAPLHETEMYDSAAIWAKKVIDSKIHSLNPSYKQIFINELQDTYDEVNRGVLWEAQFYGNSTGIHQEEGRLGNTNGIAFNKVSMMADSGYSYGFIYATRKLYNLYGNNDLRRDWAIAPYKYKSDGSRSYFSNTFIYDRNMGKWRRSYETLTPKNKNFNGTNFPILRYADVLLMFAEADNIAKGSPSQDAYDAVNEVRRRGYGLPVDQPDNAVDISGLDKDGFQKEIVDERARELCFEGLRRADLIRWGSWTQTMREASVQMNNDLSGSASWSYASLGATNAASSSRYLLYPIPSSETSVNKAAKQNPGY